MRLRANKSLVFYGSGKRRSAAEVQGLFCRLFIWYWNIP